MSDDLKAAVEEAIADRRADAEYMARRARHVAENRTVLDRLAEQDDTCSTPCPTCRPKGASDDE